MRLLPVLFLLLSMPPLRGQEVIPRPTELEQPPPEQPPQTPVPQGENVEIRPLPEVLLRFPKVTEAGFASCQVRFEGPRHPTHYLVGDPPIYLNLECDADYQGPVGICITYAPGLFPDQGADLRILRREGELWKDETRTLDRRQHQVCGELPRLAPLLLAVRSIDGLYEDLALTVRQIPLESTQLELAEPILNSREAALRGDRQAFREQLESLRRKVRQAPPERIAPPLNEWILYFIGRIEARILAQQSTTAGPGNSDHRPPRWRRSRDNSAGSPPVGE